MMVDWKALAIIVGCIILIGAIGAWLF